MLETRLCFPLLASAAGCHCAIRENATSLSGVTAALHAGRSPLTLLTVTSQLSMLADPLTLYTGCTPQPHCLLYMHLSHSLLLHCTNTCFGSERGSECSAGLTAAHTPCMNLPFGQFTATHKFCQIGKDPLILCYILQQADITRNVFYFSSRGILRNII